jgi:hypothetical protein
MIKKISVILIVTLTFGFMLPNLAKGERDSPKGVEPVIYDGIKYVAVGMSSVQAWDVKTVENLSELWDVAKPLWELKVYEVEYNTDLERDVQDVWITSLSIEDGKLIVVNEKGDKYEVDLKTQGIKKREPLPK